MGVTVWRVERHAASGDEPTAYGEVSPVSRLRSPRERFVASAPVPVSPGFPPVGQPTTVPIPRPPAAPPAVRAQQAPAVVPPPDPYVLPPAGQYVVPLNLQYGAPNRRATRSRYDWRVTRHAARPADAIEGDKHFLATFGWTSAWYAVPYALFAAWTLTFPANPGTACARPLGNACPSPRSLALTTLIHGTPRVGVALGIALLMAGLIRLGSGAWRPVTAGFASAIIGAGLATVLYSVLNSTA